MLKVVVDAMGGDNGIKPIVDGVQDALKTKDFEAIIVGDENLIKKYLDSNVQDKIKVIHCDDFIKMEDMATNALKNKNSSIYQAVEIVRNNEADVVISAGHSGASMSLATLRFGRIDGVSRPAICTTMPRIDGKVSIILDAGANVDCKPEHLVEFARMGYEYAKNVLLYENPRVGLLANGEEDNKGNELTKEVFKTLKKFPYFKGNVEGNDIFNGSIEVIVCDGFSGNLVLKASEGVADAIGKILKEEIYKSFLSKIGAMLMRNAFKMLKKRTHYAEYGGAPLLGVKKNLIICHGKSNARAIECAIYQGISAVETRVIEKIANEFNK
ncbi:MAG: phosphate acyltransferase PlsX [Helicobacteraceae bacterium]|nr:phosphate acyltransferase PlsX [Helicobacteraceae bacterium]